jgi:hypothetical protein
VLPPLIAVALTALAAALALGATAMVAPAAWAHAAFAAGVMPLILGAMGYFVPVLTRSRGAPAAVRAVPAVALAAGALAVASLAMPQRFAGGPTVAALAGLIAAAVMLVWIFRRGRAALGAPHPGLLWYLAACLFLALALLAVPAMALWPGERAALRLLHLHLNTVGFVGLTAIGTLQVLLPTAAGRIDVAAASRLRRDLPFAVAGVLLIAAGAAWFKPASHVGLLLLLVPLARLAAAWFQGFREVIVQSGGAAPSLALATAGFVMLLLDGAAHGAGWLPGRAAIGAFIAAFLLPLVSGAATQLLPVWLRPGLPTPWHASVRRRLGRGSALRAALMVSGGALMALSIPVGRWLAAAGFALFAATAVTVLFGGDEAGQMHK